MNPFSSYEKCSFKLLTGSMPSYFSIIINILTPRRSNSYISFFMCRFNRDLLIGILIIGILTWPCLLSEVMCFLKVTNVCLATLVLLGFLMYSDAFGSTSGSLKTPSGKQSSNFHNFITCTRNYKDFFF